MRRIPFLLALGLLIALPLAAQNTDIESLSGLQFNFGNPGARSLGMGGAFLGLADDASAAEANPAGLTVLRKPEVSLEARNFQENQVLTTSGTFPDLKRTAFSSYSQRVNVSFASFVYPVGHFAFGLYFHEPLRNDGTGSVVKKRDPFTGKTVDVPNFFLPRTGAGGPITRAQCETLRNSSNDPLACLEYRIKPFLSAVSVQEKTFGLTAAWKIGKLSLGGTARYHRFNETAFTFRVTEDGEFDSISVQATSDVSKDDSSPKAVTDITFTGGAKVDITDRLSLGAVYKKGPKFAAPTFSATADTNFEFVKVANTAFHVPDIYGVGVSFRPIPVLTINADAVRVKYSNLVDDFASINDTVRGIDHAYRANDVLEVRLGGEYFFSTKVPFALRAGAWRDPEHTVDFRGPLTSPDAVAAATLFPKTKTQNHLSVGGGFAWPRFQIDFAYDRSDLFKVGSLSAVVRF